MIKVVGFNRDQLNGVEVQQRGKHGCKRAAWLGSQSGGVLKRACLVLNPYWRHRLGLVKPWPSSAVDNGVLNAYWRHRLGLGGYPRRPGVLDQTRAERGVLNAYWRHRLGLGSARPRFPQTSEVLNAYWRHRLGLAAP